jgi:hypothetical protein
VHVPFVTGADDDEIASLLEYGLSSTFEMMCDVPYCFFESFF